MRLIITCRINKNKIMNDSSKHLANLRKEYQLNELSKQKVDKNPFKQFEQWFTYALNSNSVYEANAVTLATANLDGKPSVRTVLLKGYSEGGFIFYTNYNSRKGKELLENPNAALLFYWGSLERQIRIEGKVSQLAAEQSQQYFQKRPKKSQIGAWASPQSQVIADRTLLEENVTHYSELYANTDVLPRPAHWGGFIVQPHTFEFWQGRNNRLHDRLQYSRQGEQWIIQRLAP